MKGCTAGWMLLLVAISYAPFAAAQTTKGPAKRNNVVKESVLPSWNEGPVKKAIIDFVSRVTKKGSSDFVPVEDRIATFDNDGTLWAEQPVIQGMFAFALAKQMAEKNPDLKTKQPFKAIVEGDKEYLHKMDMKTLVGLIVATHTGMGEEEFDQAAKRFFEMAKHPTLNVPLAQVVYKPQVELLAYLRANGFKTFICSGGTVEFMRVISKPYFGIPGDQVIGTRFKYSYNDSLNIIVREPQLASFNDKAEKPVNIQYQIGKRPIFACGNERSGGDIYMLHFSQGGTYPSFQLLINHDDENREFAYQEEDNISLLRAEQYKWNVVSMKNDWKEIFVK